MINHLPFLQYLLEANFCLLLLFAVYYLFFRKETYFQFNRGYLLVAPLLSLLLPFIHIEPAALTVTQSDSSLGFVPATIQYAQQSEVLFQQSLSTTPMVWSLSVADLFLFCYGAICLLIVARLMLSVLKIKQLIASNKVEERAGYKLVVTSTETPAFSFFNYLFWNGQENENTPLIIEHEKIHIQQKHSFDVIIIELAVAVFWINPIIYFYKRHLKTVHEYIADAHVLHLSGEREKYAGLLFSMLPVAAPTSLVTSFNSQLKNRLAMMYQKKSSSLSRWKVVLLIPVLATLFALFSFNQVDIDPLISKLEDEVNQSILAIEKDALKEKTILNRPYFLKFGEVEFQLYNQKGDGKRTNPPSYVLTYKSMHKILKEEAVLINKNTGEQYEFNFDYIKSKETFDPNAVRMNNPDLRKEIKSIPTDKAVHVGLKNIEVNGKDVVLDFSLYLIPENSIRINWHNYEIPLNGKIQLDGNEFIQLAAQQSIRYTHAILLDSKLYFSRLEKKATDGTNNQLQLNHMPITKNEELTKKDKQAITIVKAGDQFTFEGLSVETPTTPKTHFFTIEISSDSNPQLVEDLMPAEQAPKKTIHHKW